MNKELFDAIKKDGLFATTRKLQAEAKAKLPQGFAFRSNLTAGSKLSTPGMMVGPDNRPIRIPNSDPEIHRNYRPVERPLLITTISAEDEPEIEETTEDDSPELNLSVAPITAGSDTESEIGPEDGDEEEGVSEGVETDGVSDAE
jgi:hypothetical protein